MQGQCSNCKGLFDVQPEWIGQQAQCPYCKVNITIQPVSTSPNFQQQSFQGQPIMNQYSVTQSENKSTGSLVCGIISLLMWLLPIVGLPLSIVGLVLGCKKNYKVGIVLNAIGLILTIINATVGAVLGAQGKLF